jgi:hypothetical protein
VVLAFPDTIARGLAAGASGGRLQPQAFTSASDDRFRFAKPSDGSNRLTRAAGIRGETFRLRLRHATPSAGPLRRE